MPRIYLVEGPVGAGKSTYCMALAMRISGVHVALDEWFARLFSPDRPSEDVLRWYLERKERLLDHIWNHSRALLAAGATPVLELGLVQRQSRAAFYQRARAEDIDLKVTVLEASRTLRRERVLRRNVERGPTYSMLVPEPVFEMASDMWQAPDAHEIAQMRIELIVTEANSP